MEDYRLSLMDLLGEGYIRAVAGAGRAVGGQDVARALALATEQVALYPEARRHADEASLCHIGEKVTEPFENTIEGAPTDAFRRAAHLAAAPLGGAGYTRVGEDGRLYFLGKSEHYHTPLGHNFPGYRLIDRAREIGVMNATHNNTRGFITRTAEREIVRAVNGIAPGDDAALEAVLADRSPRVLNRVINLETGSLAVEAGVKMMLNRFCRLDANSPAPKYAGRTPVFLVMADETGGPEANYHGTTVLTQMMRGLWSEFYRKLEEAGIFKVVQVAINDAADFAEKIERYNRLPYKTAGFLHEIVLMNYGAICLTPEYLSACHAAARATDTPVLVDEIQSCMWYEGMFLFRQYGLHPDFAVIGKGFPGGEYPASRLITTAEMDTLNQFGALVTNGQEELASLSYLVTMAYAREIGPDISKNGAWFEAALRDLVVRHPSLLVRAEGRGLLSALHFHTLAQAAAFAAIMNERCVDVSAQTYKRNCPPAVLVKPPILCGEAALEFLIEAFDGALEKLEPERRDA